MPGPFRGLLLYVSVWEVLLAHFYYVRIQITRVCWDPRNLNFDIPAIMEWYGMAVYKVLTRRGWEWQKARLKADGVLLRIIIIIIIIILIVVRSTSVITIIIIIIIAIVIAIIIIIIMIRVIIIIIIIIIIITKPLLIHMSKAHMLFIYRRAHHMFRKTTPDSAWGHTICPRAHHMFPQIIPTPTCEKIALKWWRRHRTTYSMVKQKRNTLKIRKKHQTRK